MPLFQDGITAQTYDADLYAEKTQIRIVYQDQNGYPQDLLWEVAKITPEEFPEDQPRLYYGRLQQQSIQFESKAALAEFQKAYPDRKLIQTGVISWRIWQHKTGMVAGLVVLMALIVYSFLFGLPALADKMAQKMPQSWEESLGKSMAASLNREESTLPKTTRLAQEFFQKCGFQTHYRIHILVVESRQVNAFAVPGGTIVLYSGLLDKITRPEQLASLLGHELGHVEERHSLRMICRSMATYVLFSVLMGDVAGVSAVIVDNGQQLQQLSFSRELEASADNYSITQMRKRRLDLKGMEQLFSVLEDAGSKSDLKIPQFLSSHPLTSERRNKAESAAKAQTDDQPNPELERLFRAIKSKLGKEESGVL